MTKRGYIFLAAAACGCLFISCREFSTEPEPAAYQYEQTKLLIDYVRRAAQLFTRKGEAAFPEFSRIGGKWFHRDRYLFIYDLTGTCVFHPVDKELVGKNLIGFKDLAGKPLIRHIIDMVTKGGRSEGWIHYLWAEPDQIMPLWKSSYVMWVKDPSGREYAIGSGIYNMRLEKQFIVETVDAAARLVEKEGVEAFRAMRDESSRFVYQDMYVFVLTMEGKAVVDPSFPPDESSLSPLEGRNLIDFKDAVGKYLVREMIEKLKAADSAWVMYMWPRTGEVKPSKKVAYIRKAKLGDRDLIVGSDLFLATPIWMK